MHLAMKFVFNATTFDVFVNTCAFFIFHYVDSCHVDLFHVPSVIYTVLHIYSASSISVNQLLRYLI